MDRAKIIRLKESAEILYAEAEFIPLTQENFNSLIDLALKGLDEKPPAHVCAHCGVEFDRTNGPQKYCSDECAKDAKRKNDAEYRAKNREKRNEYNRAYRQQKKADFETYLNGSTPPKDMGGE